MCVTTPSLRPHPTTHSLRSASPVHIPFPPLDLVHSSLLVRWHSTAWPVTLVVCLGGDCFFLLQNQASEWVSIRKLESQYFRDSLTRRYKSLKKFKFGSVQNQSKHPQTESGCSTDSEPIRTLQILSESENVRNTQHSNFLIEPPHHPHPLHPPTRTRPHTPLSLACLQFWRRKNRTPSQNTRPKLPGICGDFPRFISSPNSRKSES